MKKIIILILIVGLVMSDNVVIPQDQTTLLDEDTLVSDSDSAAATQQSVKAYIDNIQKVSSYNDNDVAVWFVFGQSNAAGFVAGTGGTAPTTAANVFVMQESARNFVAYNNTDNNVATSSRPTTRNPATTMADAWQTRIDGGATLPDLYIVNVSDGAQGFSPNVTVADNNRWNPTTLNSAATDRWHRPIRDVVDADVSLHLLMHEAVGAAINLLSNNFGRPVVLGAAFVHGEADNNVTAAAEYNRHLHRFYGSFLKAASLDKSNFFVPLLSPYTSTGSDGTIQLAQKDLATSFEDVKTLDLSTSPSYTGTGPNYGIYTDGLHYDVTAQDWIVDEILAQTVDADNLGYVPKFAGTVTDADVNVGWREYSTLLNSWTNVGGNYENLQYKILGQNVYVRGKVVAGTLNAAIQTLPIEYRPDRRQDFACYSVNGGTEGVTRVEIRKNGDIFARSGGVGGTVSISMAYTI